MRLFNIDFSLKDRYPNNMREIMTPAAQGKTTAGLTPEKDSLMVSLNALLIWTFLANPTKVLDYAKH